MRKQIDSVFLSHNSEDKPLVREIGKILELHGLKVWIDEAEIKFGDSLIQKISDGINSVDCLLAFISENSVSSFWVKKELGLAVTKEITTAELKVIPIILDNCQIPFFLSDKLYLKYNGSVVQTTKTLLESLGIVFNSTVFDGSINNLTLNDSVKKAIQLGLRILSYPYNRPHQYIGLSTKELSKALNANPNKNGNFHIENELAKLNIEMEGGFASFIDIDLKQTKPHTINQKFDSETLLGTLSINPSELEKVREQINFHSYYDHSRKMKVAVYYKKVYNLISVAFSKALYGS